MSCDKLSIINRVLLQETLMKTDIFTIADSLTSEYLTIASGPETHSSCTWAVAGRCRAVREISGWVDVWQMFGGSSNGTVGYVAVPQSGNMVGVITGRLRGL